MFGVHCVYWWPGALSTNTSIATEYSVGTHVFPTVFSKDFDSNFTELFSWGSYWQYVIIPLDNDLMLNRQQAITWTMGYAKR